MLFRSEGRASYGTLFSDTEGTILVSAAIDGETGELKARSFHELKVAQLMALSKRERQAKAVTLYDARILIAIVILLLLVVLVTSLQR